MQKTRLIVSAALLWIGAVGWSAHANAQEERSYLKQHLPPPEGALELKLGTAYTQGFGDVAPNRSINSVAGAGLGLSVDADYRVDPRKSFGLETQYQEFSSGANRGSRGLALNVGVTYHASPGQRGDPWLRLGTGYRMLWDVEHGGMFGPTNMYHGFDIATLKVGYDIRIAPDVAVSPVIGASLQTFIWKDADSLPPGQLGTFIHAGLQGRFDTPAPTTGGVISAKR